MSATLLGEHALTVPLDHAAKARSIAAAIGEGAGQRDRKHMLPYEAFALLRESGLGALRVPVHFGGPRASFREIAVVYTELAKADPNVAQAFIPHLTSVERLAIIGTKHQQAHFFPRILAGELFGVANAELGGKIRGGIRTTLRRDGAGYRLHGTKFYSTGSLFAQHLRISAVTEENRKVAVLIPRDREGVRLLDDWDGMGQRTTASGTTELDDVIVHENEIMYPGRWQGLVRDYSDSAVHLLHASIEVGICQAVLEDAVEYAGKHARPIRESGVERAVEDPFIQHTVGSIAARTHAAEAFLLHAADIVDRAADAPAQGLTTSAVLERLVAEAAVVVSEIKIVAADAALSAAQMLYEVGGASITRAGANYDRHWRNARTHTTHDPLAYRAKALGAWFLDGVVPPIGNA